MKNLFVKLKNDNLLKFMFSLLILFFIASIIISPAKYIAQGLNGISAWAFNVLPSVLPFMFFTKALSSLGQIEKLTRPFQRVTKALFNTPPISFYAFFMAILSGYPVGSKMIADLYIQGKISKDEAYRMSAFCSTSGPMFIIGAVDGRFPSVFSFNSTEEMDEALKELALSNGDVPKETKNLANVALLKNLAQNFNVKLIRINTKECLVYFYKSEEIIDKRLSKMSEFYPFSLKFEELPILKLQTDENVENKMKTLIKMFKRALT